MVVARGGILEFLLVLVYVRAFLLNVVAIVTRTRIGRLGIHCPKETSRRHGRFNPPEQRNVTKKKPIWPTVFFDITEGPAEDDQARHNRAQSHTPWQMLFPILPRNLRKKQIVGRKSCPKKHLDAAAIRSTNNKTKKRYCCCFRHAPSSGGLDLRLQGNYTNASGRRRARIRRSRGR